MSELYINKWWGNYVGGCDDSLLLLDYFGNKETDKFSLKQIFNDLHLDEILHSGELEAVDLYFEVNKDYIPHFDIALDVVIDLSAIVIECLYNKKVKLKDLDKYSKHDKTVEITAASEDIRLLKNGLDFFICSPQLSELFFLMSDNELNELIDDCKGLSKELEKYFKIDIVD